MAPAPASGQQAPPPGSRAAELQITAWTGASAHSRRRARPTQAAAASYERRHCRPAANPHLPPAHHHGLGVRPLQQCYRRGGFDPNQYPSLAARGDSNVPTDEEGQAAENLHLSDIGLVRQQLPQARRELFVVGHLPMVRAGWRGDGFGSLERRRRLVLGNGERTSSAPGQRSVRLISWSGDRRRQRSAAGLFGRASVLCAGPPCQEAVDSARRSGNSGGQSIRAGRWALTLTWVRVPEWRRA